MITVRNFMVFLGLVFTSLALILLLPWLLYTNIDNLRALQALPLIGAIPFIGTTISYIYLAVLFALLGAICYFVVQSSRPIIWGLALAAIVLALTYFLGGFANYVAPGAVIAGNLLANQFRVIQKNKPENS